MLSEILESIGVERKKVAPPKCAVCGRTDPPLYEVVTDNGSIFYCFDHNHVSNVIETTANIYVNCTFDNFVRGDDLKEYGYSDEEIAVINKMYLAFLRLAKAILRGESGNIVVCGKSGVGKTHLVNAIRKKLIGFGKKVYYIQWYHFINKVYDAVNGHLPRTSLYEEMKNSDLVIIDDLSYLPDTDYAKKVIMEIVDIVYSQNHSLIITSNFKLEKLFGLFSEASLDRLKSKTVFLEVAAKSWRRYGKLNKRPKGGD